MRFRDIIGHRELIGNMIKAVSAGRIPHAQLLWGPEGNEKLALALAYAQYVNCPHKLTAGEADLNGLPSDSCGQCPSCLKFEKLVHPDLHFIYPNNANGGSIKKDSRSLDYIEEWRSLCLATDAEFSFNQWVETMGIGNRQAIINIRDCHQITEALSLKASEARYRILVVWMIEKLSPSIASTLLKTLEEPEPQTLFLLVSENPDQILPTILSRTQMIKIPRLATEEITAYLEKKTGVEEHAAKEIAAASAGNLLSALSLCANSETRKNFHEDFATWMRLCFKVDMAALIAFSEKSSAAGRENLKLFLQNCLDELQACLLTANHCTRWLHPSENERTFWENFSKYVDNQNIHQYYKLFNDAIFAISRNGHVPSIMTDMSMELCRILDTARQKLKKQMPATAGGHD